MNWLDIIILVIAGIAALIGWRIGLIRAVTSLVGIIVAIVLASQFFKEVAPLFEGVLDSENGANILGFLLIFVAVLIVTAVASTFVRSVINMLMLGWVDKGGGLVVGILLSFALMSAVLSVVDSFPVLSLEETVAESTFGSFLVEDFSVVLEAPKLLPDDLTSDLPDL